MKVPQKKHTQHVFFFLATPKGLEESTKNPPWNGAEWFFFGGGGGLCVFFFEFHLNHLVFLKKSLRKSAT